MQGSVRVLRNDIKDGEIQKTYNNQEAGYTSFIQKKIIIRMAKEVIGH